jgi:hypothetical protein
MLLLLLLLCYFRCYVWYYYTATDGTGALTTICYNATAHSTCAAACMSNCIDVEVLQSVQRTLITDVHTFCVLAVVTLTKIQFRRDAVDTCLALFDKPLLPDSLIQIMAWVLGEYAYLAKDDGVDQSEVAAKLCNMASGR